MKLKLAYFLILAIFFNSFLLGNSTENTFGFYLNPSKSLVIKGNEAFNNENYQEALQYYQKALEKKSSDSYIFNNLANTYLAIQDYPNASFYYGKAAEYALDKNFKKKSYYNQGNAFFYEKKMENAIESYKKALKISPKENKIKKNLEIALKQKQEQNKKKNQEKKNKNDESNQDKEKNKKEDTKNSRDDQKEQKSEEQNENQDNNESENSKNKDEKQQSSKISKEQAEKLLDKLNQKKKQQIIIQQSSQNNDQKDKNW